MPSSGKRLIVITAYNKTHTETGVCDVHALVNRVCSKKNLPNNEQEKDHIGHIVK